MSAPIELSRTVRPASAFVHPLFLGSLALLALNDHVLKGSGLLPGWLTGKLSDFAGLVFAPPLFAALLGVRSRRGLAIATGAVGVGFTLLELSGSATALAEAAYAAFGLTWRSWSDPTDLLALAMLPVSYALVVRTSLEVPARATRARAEILFGAAGVFASVATSQTMEPTTCTSETFDCDADGWGTPDDCDDYDPSVFPGQGCLSSGAESVCDDGVDQDGDGATDCDDLDCSFACADLQAVCGALVPTDLATTTALVGSTDLGTSVTDGTCIGADAPEVLFQVQSALAGTLTIGVPAGHGVHVRSSCPAAHTEIVCAAPGEPAPTVTVSVEPNVPLTVVVEAEDALLSGPFQAPLTFEAEACGALADATALTVGSSTSTFDSAPEAAVSSCSGSPIASRRTFEIVPTASGTLSVVASSPADVVLSARTACDVASELACSDDAGVGSLESLTVPTVGGTPVYVVVERIGGDGVDLTLTTTLTPP